MINRAGTLIRSRCERLERILGRRLEVPEGGSHQALSDEAREYLREEAEALYWDDLKWERVTGEEDLDLVAVAQLSFPGFLAFIRGLLLNEVMPDSMAPASPSPQVVEDLLTFLAQHVVDLEDGTAEPQDRVLDEVCSELDLTSQLIDVVLCHFYQLGLEEIKQIAAEPASAL